MDREPIRDEILEAMEACRTAEDLHDPRFSELARALSADPELAHRYEQLQRSDARIQAAFHDVPVPQGLHARITARLATMMDPAVGQESVPESSQTCPATTSWENWPTPPAKRFSRRGLLVAGAVAAMAAAVMVAVFLGLKMPRSYTPSEVLDEVAQLFDLESREGGRIAAQTGHPPADYPFSRDVLELQGMRWHVVKQEVLGGQAVAYDLPGRPGVRATLYVVRETVHGLPTEAPVEPPHQTNGVAAAAWQSGDLLYVLVVQGDPSHYRDYLTRSRSGRLA